MTRRGLFAGAALLLVLCVVAAVYAPTLHHTFVFDDEVYVVRNRHVRYGVSTAAVRWAFTAFDCGNWHPLTWLSHLADVELYNMDAGKHHRANVVLHLANTLLLFVALRGMTGALWRSLLATALFALHPLRVESVAWVAERKDLLCASFWLLALIAWRAHLRRPAAGRYLAVVALYVLGLMSKPMIVTFPCLLLVLDGWPFGRIGPRSRVWPLVREKMPFFLLSAASAVVAVLAQRSGGAVGTLGDYPLGARLATAATAFTFYLRKTAWPVDLAVFYPNRAQDVPWGEALVSAAVLAVVTGLVWRHRRRGYPLAGWCWYLGTLMPVIGIVQVGDQSYADRYTYVPLVGVLVLIAWGAGDVAGGSWRRAGALAVASCVALAALTALSSRQVAFWKDDLTLFGHAARAAPNSWLAYGNLGLALSRENRFAEALPLYEKALRLYPDHYETLANLGRLLSTIGRKPEAVAMLTRAIVLSPDREIAYVNLGYVYVSLRDKEAAMEVYRRLLAVDREEAARFLPIVETLP